MIDWITGDKFIRVADLVYAPGGKSDCNPQLNTFCLCALKEVNIVYTHTMYVKDLFNIIKKLKCKFVIITHNCDENVDLSYVIPDNVIKWYAQNVNVENPKIQSIPIGLENDKWFAQIRKREKMEAKLRTPRNIKNIAYLNSNIATNPKERQPLYDLFEKEPWVTTERGTNGKRFEEYLDNIYSHLFVFCPVGNGIDTHRLWETLYMASIPIIKKDKNSKFYEDLPICFVNNWNEVTEEYLQSALQVIPMLDWDGEMLNFEYWKNMILLTAAKVN